MGWRVPFAMVWHVSFVKVWHVLFIGIWRVPFLEYGICCVPFLDIHYSVPLAPRSTTLECMLFEFLCIVVQPYSL